MPDNLRYGKVADEIENTIDDINYAILEMEIGATILRSLIGDISLWSVVDGLNAHLNKNIDRYINSIK